MYVPESFRVDERESLLDFVRSYPFAVLVSTTEDGPVATHLPLEIEWPEAEPSARILGHVARANTHWRHFDAGTPSVAIFSGPHAYISPTWYEAGPAVPTWNYAAVHAIGVPRVIDEPEQVGAILDRLIARYESQRAESSDGDLPADYRAKLQQAIVAFELPVDRFQGKFKHGQSRSPADRDGVLAGLEREGDAGATELARFVWAIESDC